MAYVAISGNLRNDVRVKINSLRQAEENALPKTEPLEEIVVTLPELREKASLAMWGEYEDLKERLSQFNKEGYVSAVFRYTEEMRADFPTLPLTLTLDPVTCSVKVDDCPGFKSIGTYRGGPHSIGIDTSSLNSHPAVHNMMHAYIQAAEAKYRWATITTQVMKFLDSCKSLNEAVKLWPDASRYIPKEYMDRMAKKVDKPEAKENKALDALKAIDLDMVNTSHVLARMAGGK